MASPPYDLGDLTGKVVVFRDGSYPDDADVPADHPFFVDGGFGARSQGKIFGTWLDGECGGFGRREWVERVVEPDELTPDQRELFQAALGKLRRSLTGGRTR